MKTIRAEDVPSGARQFLATLDVSGEGLVYEEGGTPILAFVSAAFLEQLLEQRRQAREDLFRTIERVRHRNTGVWTPISFSKNLNP